jgi:hypothetical protein
MGANHDPERRPLSEETRAWLRTGPYLSDIVPLRVNAGVVHSIHIECNGCGEPIPMGQTAARLTEPVPGVQVVDLAAVCHSCRTVTFGLWRFRPDGRAESLQRHGWKEFSFLQRRKRRPWWDLAGWLEQTLRRLRI